MQATHPDHLRQLVDEHRRALQDEASGNRIVQQWRDRRGASASASTGPAMTSRVIAIVRQLRQGAWRTRPATRGELR